MTPSWLWWWEIARQVYARFGAIFPGKTLEITWIEREKTINRGKKSLFLLLKHFEVLKKAFYVLALKIEQQMSQNCAHYFAGCVSCRYYIVPVETGLDGSP